MRVSCIRDERTNRPIMMTATPESFADQKLLHELTELFERSEPGDSVVIHTEEREREFTWVMETKP